MTGRNAPSQLHQEALIDGVQTASRLRGDARDVARRRHRRASQRDVYIPPIADPQRRAACESSLRLFCETYLPDMFTIPWSPVHLRIIRALEDVVLRSRRIVLVAPRGTGKSTLIIAAVLWALLYGHRSFLVIICDTHEHSKARMAAIRMIIETNDLLADDFPGPCVCARALEGKYNRANGQTVMGERTRLHWGGDALIVFPTIPGVPSSGSAIAVKSMDTAIRGLQHARPDGSIIRPDLVLLDDPISNQDALSEPICLKYARKIDQEVMGLAGPTTMLTAVYLGTIIRKGDLTSTFLNKTDWQGLRFQLRDAMPENEKLWEAYSDILDECYEDEGDVRRATAFYQEHRAEMDAGAAPTWPERFRAALGEVSAVQFAMDVYYEDPTHHVFWAEYQNDPREEDETATLVLDATRVASKSTGLPRARIPDNALALVSGWDVGKSYIHWIVAACAPARMVSIIDYGVEDVYAPAGRVDPRDKAHYQAVELALLTALRHLRDKFLDEPYRKQSDEEMPILFTLVDARYLTKVVRAFTQESGAAYGLVMGRGTGKHQPNWTAPPKAARLARDGNVYALTTDGARIYHAHTDNYKQILHTGFLLDDPSPGSVALFARTRRTEHHAFSHHITAERQIEMEAGKYVWKKVAGRRANHWLDASSYTLAAVSLVEELVPALGIGMPQQPRAFRRPRRRRLSVTEL